MMRHMLMYSGKLMHAPMPMVMMRRPPRRYSRYLPERSMNHPAKPETTASGRASASIQIPAMRGEALRVV